MDTGIFITDNASHSKFKVIVQNGKLVFRSAKSKFDAILIREILQFVNTVVTNRYPKGMPILFHFVNKITFSDKIIYILLECICYYLIEYGHPVYIKIAPRFHITTYGFQSSPLLLLTTGKARHVEKYKKRFHQDYYGRHFRKVLAKTSKNEELSILLDEIATFQKPFDIEEKEREKISEVLIELVGNAMEHSNEDCLIDLDITARHLKRGEDKKNYLGINIVILNFSESLLGTSLQKKLAAPKNLSGRYQQVEQAFQAHKPFFGEDYHPDDFFNIAAFQHKISGRMDGGATGGTGLTLLIHSLEEDSDAYNCYVISGNRRLDFTKDYMLFNNEGWIGFNVANDFLSLPPDPSLLKKNPFSLPGTAYNLTFVMEANIDE